jgi:hypothetical protein
MFFFKKKKKKKKKRPKERRGTKEKGFRKGREGIGQDRTTTNKK